MKNKIHKLLGVGLTLVIALSLVAGFAVPVAAAETINEWYKFDYPVDGSAGDWFRQGPYGDGERIGDIGPIAEAINDDLYAFVDFWGDITFDDNLLKSTDGGRTWALTDYAADLTGEDDIVDMVCSSIDEDIIYVTDGDYVYKSTDGGDEFAKVAPDTLEELIEGACGINITDDPITCLDVTYDDDDNPFVFIGVDSTDVTEAPSAGEPTVLYLNEGGYPSTWTDLELHCFKADAGTPGNYTPYSIGNPPNWADSRETYVVVTTYDELDDINPTDPHTWVVFTTGTPCSWNELAELFWNCDTDNNFEIQLASRIAFPDDFEDIETLFVGVVDVDDCTTCYASNGDWYGCGGDVYSATDGLSLDRNVAGISAGCAGVEAVDILSLDIEGDYDEARLIAGAYCDTTVYYSEDGGWDWDASDKNPTGEDTTYVLWYGDSAVAATSGWECAFSLSCVSDEVEDVGEAWNQISLIATDIDCVRYLDHSPGYITESETMFMVTWSQRSRYPNSVSVFRYDQDNWERVFLNITYGADPFPIWAVGVSPDFNETNCVYLVNGYFEMFRTLDAGCSWTQLTFPCEERPDVTAMVVIDEDTVIVGGIEPDDPNDPKVYKTTRHGARPWDEYDLPTAVDTAVMSFALEPGYEDPGSILLGDMESQVCISEDGGEEWDLVDAELLTSNRSTWVVFDPGYATNNTIFGAAGNVIGRCVIDPDEDWADQEWVDINTLDSETFWGIHAIGDTALYVGSYREVGYDEPPWDGGVFRSLNPLEEDEADVVFERVWEGLDVDNGDPDGSRLRALWVTSDVSDEGCAENVLWALEPCWYETPDHPRNVWVYEDTLAAPVVLNMPIDGQKLTTTDSATLSWNELCGAECYEVALWQYCPECPEEKLDVTLDDLCPEGEGAHCTTAETCIVVGPRHFGLIDGLESGTTYYWQVRVCEGEPYLSKWSEERTFSTALLAVPFRDLCSPPCGDQDIILTPNFSWEAVVGATGYDIELATTETFTAGVIRGSSTVNAWVLSAPLDYATTYYWRVRAEKNGVYSDWTICLFTTMEAPEVAPPPVVVEPTPPAPVVPTPIIEFPPTPSWVWAIIGIGTALVVVVIVLTVRTRRPPA